MKIGGGLAQDILKGEMPIDKETFSKTIKEATAKFLVEHDELIKTLPVTYYTRNIKNLVSFIYDAIRAGKLFVEFVALIFISYINKKMQEQGLYKNYTMQQLLDKLDVIECFSYPGHDLRVGEVLEKQKDLYIKLGVEPPALL